jgi:uncharacterized protein YukE
VTRAPSAAERIETWLGPVGEAYSLIKPLVEFLTHPLDQVTGDPDQLLEKAQAWRDAAARLDGFAQTELRARTDLLSYWEGEAASAFDAEMVKLNESLTEIGEHFEVTAQLLEGSAEAARQAQELVEQIIKELIAWLVVTIIVALASSWITAGASLAAGTAAGATEAAVAGTRAAAVGVRLANILRRVAAFLKRMSEFAKTYKLTTIRQIGVKEWATARYATSSGYQLIATNWVIKKAVVQPTVGPSIDKVTGADKTWQLPQVF